MTSETDKLHSLLFEGVRELVNIRFFPGTNRGLTDQQMRDEAAIGIAAAFERGSIDSPPMSGQEKTILD